MALVSFPILSFRVEPGNENNGQQIGSNVIAAALFPNKNRTFEKPVVVEHSISKVKS